MSSEKTCPVDGVRFIQAKPWQKFCSLKCRREHLRHTLPDISVRFPAPEDYVLIRSAAKTAEESVNLFITTAALARARSIEARGPIPVHRQPQASTPIAQSS